MGASWWRCCCGGTPQEVYFVARRTSDNKPVFIMYSHFTSSWSYDVHTPVGAIGTNGATPITVQQDYGDYWIPAYAYATATGNKLCVATYDPLSAVWTHREVKNSSGSNIQTSSSDVRLRADSDGYLQLQGGLKNSGTAYTLRIAYDVVNDCWAASNIGTSASNGTSKHGLWFLSNGDRVDWYGFVGSVTEDIRFYVSAEEAAKSDNNYPSYRIALKDDVWYLGMASQPSTQGKLSVFERLSASSWAEHNVFSGAAFTDIRFDVGVDSSGRLYVVYHDSTDLKCAIHTSDALDGTWQWTTETIESPSSILGFSVATGVDVENQIMVATMNSSNQIQLFVRGISGGWTKIETSFSGGFDYRNWGMATRGYTHQP